MRLILIRVIRFFAKGLIALLIVLLLYFVAALIGSIIPVNSKEVENPEVTIYLRSNGVHTDFVFPVKNEVMDWSGIIDPRLTLSGRDDFRFISIGWGDLEFYRQTQEWRDLEFPVALRAVFLHKPAALHVEFQDVLRFDQPLLPVDISEEQYQTLIDYVLGTFKMNYSEKLQPVSDLHYNRNDLFFRARGSLNLFYTCNTWVNNGLKAAEMKACLWTPFDEGIFYRYR